MSDKPGYLTEMGLTVEARNSALAGLRVLHLEDEPSDQELIRIVLETRLGRCRFTPAQTGAEFEAALEAGGFDLILSDYTLPAYDGAAALAAAHQRCPEVPFILVSATIGEEQAVETLKNGATDYVLKDHLDRLAPAVERAVREARERAERKRAEQSLRESEQRYRALADNAPTGIFINVDGRFAYVNEAFCRILGAQTPDQLLGTSVFDRFHPDCVEPIRQRIAHIHGTGEPVPLMDERFFRLDGSVVDVETSAAQITFGGRPAVLVMVNDVTLRRQAEEALKQRTRLAMLTGDVGVALTKKGSSRKVLRLCAEAIVRHLDAAFARIWTLNDAEQVLELQASAGMYTHLNGPHGRVPVGAFKIGRIAQERKPHLTNSVIGDPRVGDQEWARREGMVAFAGYPLIVEDRLVGVMALFARQALSEATLTALEAAADGIALGIERKRAEEALAEEAVRRRILVEQSTDGIVVLDENGAVCEANRRYVEMLGYAPEEVLGLHVWDWDAQWNREQILEKLRDVDEAGARFETRHRRKDGTLYDVEISTNGTLVAGQKLVFCVCRDITRRKQAEKSLAEERRLLRTLIDNLPLHIFVKDTAGRYLASNASHTRLLGADTEAEVLGKTVFNYFPRPLAEAFDRDDQALFRTGQPVVQREEVCQEGGHRRWYSLIKVPLRDTQGTITGLVGVKFDITERKEAGLRLEIEYTANRVLAEARTFPDAVQQLLGVLCDKLGWRVGELWTLDRQVRALRCAHVCHPPGAAFAAFAEATRQRTFANDEGLPGHVWASGQPAFVPDVTQDESFLRGPAAVQAGLLSAVAFPIRRQNAVLGVLEFFATEMRQPNAALLAMLETLAGKIGLALEREHLAEEFRQAHKMEAVGQLAGGVAHDFNNLLTVIQGNLGLIALDSNLTEETKDSIKEITEASERASSLTRQLLAFSRKQTLHPQPLDLNRIAEDLSKMLRRVIGEDVTLQLRLAPDLPAVHADSGMMEQVLMNLAVNARDAMPQGGSLVVATRVLPVDAAHVSVHPAAREGEFVCLSVRDTGTGIAPDILARIFEPFFSTKAVGKGTGLGLATVHGITQQHQGWVEVETVVGAGTTFHVYLPARRELRPAGQRPAHTATMPRGHEGILIVEDEPALREVTAVALNRVGYRVFQAHSGVGALDVWDTHAGQIDLVLSDVIMPEGMNGRQLVEELRNRKPGLKAILVSGYSADILEESWAQEHHIRFLQKPFPLPVLIQAVRESLDAKA